MQTSDVELMRMSDGRIQVSLKNNKIILVLEENGTVNNISSKLIVCFKTDKILAL